jgi:hypothetical protein
MVFDKVKGPNGARPDHCKFKGKSNKTAEKSERQLKVSQLAV